MDLNKLELKLDDALSKETTESLTNWLNNKRMEKKQTAVEWLVDKVFCKRTCKWKGVIEQAKEMEKEQTEILYTEEQVIEFTKWLASNWFALWVKDKFLWECDWSENAENQDYKGYYTEKQLLELFKSIKQKPNE